MQVDMRRAPDVSPEEKERWVAHRLHEAQGALLELNKLRPDIAQAIREAAAERRRELGRVLYPDEEEI